MSGSILVSTKKILGVAEDDPDFDLDILTHINSVFSTLQQLGVGPDEGFMIEDADATWDDFLNADNRLNAVKTYVYLRIRMLFDPPATSFHLEAIKQQLAEMEWRLNVSAESATAPATTGFGVSPFGIGPFGI